MVSMHRLFVYGTLRHPPLIEGLVGRSVASRPATLADHRAAPMRGRAYPGLVADRGAETVGSLVEVDDHGLAVLDDFEGVEYTRTPVTVMTADGSVDAEAYLLTGPTIARTESAHHTGWIEDREHIREGLRVRPLHAQLGHERR